MLTQMSWDSSVGRATGCGLDDRVQSPVDRHLFLCYHAQNDCVVHPASNGSFSGGKAAGA
jgi:hypothetical protein